MDIVTIQHTESEHHLNRMVGSWYDWPLTSLGLQQAKLIVHNILAAGIISVGTIYSSDLVRCSVIAELLGAATGLPVETTHLLRGKYYGEACGKPDEWLEEHRLPYKGFDARDIDYRYLNDAENTIDESKRLAPVFQSLLNQGKDFVLVGHGDVLNLFYAFWLGASFEQLRHADIFTQPGSVSHFKELPSGKRLALRIGDMSFLNAPSGISQSPQ